MVKRGLLLGQAKCALSFRTWVLSFLTPASERPQKTGSFKDRVYTDGYALAPFIRYQIESVSNVWLCQVLACAKEGHGAHRLVEHSAFVVMVMEVIVQLQTRLPTSEMLHQALEAQKGRWLNGQVGPMVKAGSGPLRKDASLAQWRACAAHLSRWFKASVFHVLGQLMCISYSIGLCNITYNIYLYR